MKKSIRVWMGSLIVFATFSYATYGQQLVEEISGIVGDEIILFSEVETMVYQKISMGDRTPTETMRCQVFEDMLVQKLFLDQARLDSLVVSPDDVERMLDMRLNEFIRQAGSEENLEQYFNKSMVEIRRDLRDMMADDQLTQQMQQTIAMEISVTPGEVRRFYNKINADSLPLIPAKSELSLIQIDPPNMEENKLEVRQRLLDLRRRIIAGESFKVLAISYSEDGSAANGGEIGFTMRGGLDEAYADEAFSLKENTVSQVVESQFGFHIIELIERNGDMINTRHILIRPKVKPEEKIEAINRLDSIADLIRRDSMSFERAAFVFSNHDDSRMNGGKYVDPSTRENLISIEALPTEMYTVVRDLKIGELSSGFESTNEKDNTVFKMVRLDRLTEPHKANLRDDYNFIQEMALGDKRGTVYQEWVNNKMETTYIKISNEFKSCKFANKGWMK